jgi:hypothetical protein
MSKPVCWRRDVTKGTKKKEDTYAANESEAHVLVAKLPFLIEPCGCGCSNSSSSRFAVETQLFLARDSHKGKPKGGGRFRFESKCCWWRVSLALAPSPGTGATPISVIINMAASSGSFLLKAGTPRYCVNM